MTTPDKEAKKDFWDKLDIFLKGLAAVVIPLVLAYIGWIVQSAITTQNTGKDYIGISLGILEQKDLTEDLKKNEGLRKWAVGLLKYYSPVTLDEKTAAELISGSATIPAVRTYNEIRNSQPAGPERTSNMTEVVTEMMAAVPQWEGKFDVNSGLVSDDYGQRLFAYVHLYVQPDFSELDQLVKSVLTIKSGEHFNQYWGIQAIGKVIASKDPSAASDRVKDELKNLLPTLYEPSDLSRYDALKRIVDTFQ
jgi:hypothetical protein